MRRSRTRRPCALLLLLLLLVIAACGPGVSPETYERIEKGMTSARVRAILGKPTRGGGFDLGDTIGLSAGTWIWEEGNRKIVIVFKDDVVLSKARTGF